MKTKLLSSTTTPARTQCSGGHKQEAADISRGAYPSPTTIWECGTSVLLECYPGFSRETASKGRNKDTFEPLKLRVCFGGTADAQSTNTQVCIAQSQLLW